MSVTKPDLYGAGFGVDEMHVENLTRSLVDVGLIDTKSVYPKYALPGPAGASESKLAKDCP